MALRHIQSDKVLSLNSTQATAEGVGNVVSVDGIDLIAFGLEFFAPSLSGCRVFRAVPACSCRPASREPF